MNAAYSDPQRHRLLEALVAEFGVAAGVAANAARSDGGATLSSLSEELSAFAEISEHLTSTPYRPPAVLDLPRERPGRQGDDLGRVVSQLPHEHRRAVVLIDCFHWSIGEVARFTGQSDDDVDRARDAAWLALRRYFAPRDLPARLSQFGRVLEAAAHGAGEAQPASLPSRRRRRAVRARRTSILVQGIVGVGLLGLASLVVARVVEDPFGQGAAPAEVTQRPAGTAVENPLSVRRPPAPVPIRFDLELVRASEGDWRKVPLDQIIGELAQHTERGRSCLGASTANEQVKAAAVDGWELLEVRGPLARGPLPGGLGETLCLFDGDRIIDAIHLSDLPASPLDTAIAFFAVADGDRLVVAGYTPGAGEGRVTAIGPVGAGVVAHQNHLFVAAVEGAVEPSEVDFLWRGNVPSDDSA